MLVLTGGNTFYYIFSMISNSTATDSILEYSVPTQGLVIIVSFHYSIYDYLVKNRFEHVNY